MDNFNRFDSKIEKTTYETDPVENMADAMHAFADAYDKLHDCLQFDFAHFNEELRAAMYKPVRPGMGSGGVPISLYEIGVAHFPNRTVAGRYSIHKGKLAEALDRRNKDVRAMLVQEETGVLPHLCEILLEFRDQEREEELPQEVYIALMRFLNECRRLAAMWL